MDPPRADGRRQVLWTDEPPSRPPQPSARECPCRVREVLGVECADAALGCGRQWHKQHLATTGVLIIYLKNMVFKPRFFTSNLLLISFKFLTILLQNASKRPPNFLQISPKYPSQILRTRACLLKQKDCNGARKRDQ